MNAFLDAPTLSICIPTYNRSRYLTKALDHLFAEQPFDFTFEVLISDNNSTDDTRDVVAQYTASHPEIRYVHQKHNVGVEANMVSAYRQARGDYTMYLADDDQLLHDGVASVVQYLDARPEVAACYSPWELYDDVDKKLVALFYHIDGETRFSRAQAIDLCNFIVDRHIFPEVYIYRSEALRRMMYRPHKTYWAFTNIINVMNYGDVVFLPTPFYCAITRHWPGEQREQEGNKQAVSEWDLYRGGIEYMFLRACSYLGLPGVPDDQRAMFNQMLQTFVNARMKVALRMLNERREYVSAQDLFVRLLANGALTDQERAAYAGQLTNRAALDVFVETFRAMTLVDCIGLFGNESAAAVRGLLQEIDADLPIDDLQESKLSGIANKESYLILCGNGACRDVLLEAGFPPGQVWAEADLLRQYVL